MQEETIKVETSKFASKAEKESWEIFRDHIIPEGKKALIEDGTLESKVFIGFDIGDAIGFACVPVGIFMDSIESKKALAGMMKKIGEKVNPLCIGMIMEAWYVKVDKKDDLDVAPADHPNREECLVCTFETENLNKSIIYGIVRDGNLVSLKDEDISEESTLGGRFAGVLKDMKKIKYN